MSRELFAAVRASAKGTGWSSKWDMLVCRLGEWVLAAHPRRGQSGIVEFRAKPVAWDHILWSILQIEGNERKPASFHFTGAFVCDTPALVSQGTEDVSSHDGIARRLVALAQLCRATEAVWKDYDLQAAIDAEDPHAPYRYHTTRVLERIHAGDREGARRICRAACAGTLDIRHLFHSCDERAKPDRNGMRPSLSFFELALIWMDRTPGGRDTARASLMQRWRRLLH